MNPYKDMYYKLFNKITVITNELQSIQQETEEMFLAASSKAETLYSSEKDE